MKKIFSLALIGALITTPALGQQATYTSINQVMLAAQQASSGQLAMVHGGYLGTAVAGSTTTDAPNMVNDPTNGIGTDNSTTIIAATVGAAVLVIPLLLSWFSGD